MAKKTKGPGVKKTARKRPEINLGKVTYLVMRIRNESNRIHLLIKSPSEARQRGEERQQLLEESNEYINKRCDELDKLLGIDTKINF